MIKGLIIFLINFNILLALDELKIHNVIHKGRIINEREYDLDFIEDSEKNIKTISRKSIDYIKRSDDSNSDFRRVVLKINKEYIRGDLLNQNQKFIKLFSNGEVVVIQMSEIEDIIKEKEFDNELSKSKYGAMWRSIIIPGLGQHYNRQHTKGYIIIGIMSTFLFSSLYFYNQQEKAYNEYASSDFYNQSSLNKHKQNVNNFNISISLLGLTYLYNIGDAFLSFKLKYNGYHPSIINIQSYNESNIEINYTWRF